MNGSANSLGEMVSSSVNVITKPSVATFEQYEKRGTLQKALFYVGVAAIVAAAISFAGGLLVGLFSDTRSVFGTALGSAFSSFVSTFINFLLFSGTTYYVGKWQGGTGTLDEVAYSFALFFVPIQVLTSLVGALLTVTIVGVCLLPFLFIASIVGYVFWAYLAVQSSMNLRDSAKTLITLGAAALATVVGSAIINAIFASVTSIS